MDGEEDSQPTKRLMDNPEAIAMITKMWESGKKKTEIARELHTITPGYSLKTVEDSIDWLIWDGTLKIRQDQLDDIQKYLKRHESWKTIPEISSSISLGRGAVNLGLEQLAKQGRVVRAPDLDSKTGSPMFKSPEKLGLGSKILSALTDSVVR
jgi:hypothetical protein